MEKSEEDLIINAHSHVFTSKHVPPYLTKKIIPWPFYYLFHLGYIVSIFKWVQSLKEYKYHNWYHNLKRFQNKLSNAIKQNVILKYINSIIKYWLIIIAFYAILEVFSSVFELLFNKSITSEKFIYWLKNKMADYHLFPNLLVWKILIILYVLIFVKSGRKLIFFILKKINSVFKLLPGKSTQELFERYLLIIEYAKYKSQLGIYKRMKDQYPHGTGFVLLSMDMSYMKAGKVKEDLEKQLEGLAKIKRKHKKEAFPFIFIDPRRINDDLNNGKVRKPLFKIKNATANNIELADCLTKTYIEDKKFSGFKIYPAMGYYPFEKELLAVWKYAEIHNLPIMTHCIKGTVFYRGKKKKEWNEHPIFKDRGNKLLLAEKKNIDFQLNFTHPMNFLCLLEEPFLRKLLTIYNDLQLNLIFGYTNKETPLKHPLTNLKICFGHYGGEEHWNKYLEKDRYGYSQQVITKPGVGIEFLPNFKTATELQKKKKTNNTIAISVKEYNRLANMWKYVDWYSIISSMMMQYPNVYADISYIVHSPSIFPLLKESLDFKNGLLPERVLYGTDFYVVRNHNSEKDLYVHSKFDLSRYKFKLIAKYNPKKYLENNLS